MPGKPHLAQFIPREGTIPDPSYLSLYAVIDPQYPAWFRATCDRELRRNFIYEMVAVTSGVICVVAALASATFLAYTGHSKMALAVLGANFLGTIGKILAKATRGSRKEETALHPPNAALAAAEQPGGNQPGEEHP
jgi:hypothetical protein